MGGLDVDRTSCRSHFLSISHVSENVSRTALSNLLLKVCGVQVCNMKRLKCSTSWLVDLKDRSDAQKVISCLHKNLHSNVDEWLGIARFSDMGLRVRWAMDNVEELVFHDEQEFGGALLDRIERQGDGSEGDCGEMEQVKEPHDERSRASGFEWNYQAIHIVRFTSAVSFEGKFLGGSEDEENVIKFKLANLIVGFGEKKKKCLAFMKEIIESCSRDFNSVDLVCHVVDKSEESLNIFLFRRFRNQVVRTGGDVYSYENINEKLLRNRYCTCRFSMANQAEITSENTQCHLPRDVLSVASDKFLAEDDEGNICLENKPELHGKELSLYDGDWDSSSSSDVLSDLDGIDCEVRLPGDKGAESNVLTGSQKVNFLERDEKKDGVECCSSKSGKSEGFVSTASLNVSEDQGCLSIESDVKEHVDILRQSKNESVEKERAFQCQENVLVDLESTLNVGCREKETPCSKVEYEISGRCSENDTLIDLESQVSAESSNFVPAQKNLCRLVSMEYEQSLARQKEDCFERLNAFKSNWSTEGDDFSFVSVTFVENIEQIWVIPKNRLCLKGAVKFYLAKLESLKTEGMCNGVTSCNMGLDKYKNDMLLLHCIDEENLYDAIWKRVKLVRDRAMTADLNEGELACGKVSLRDIDSGELYDVVPGTGEFLPGVYEIPHECEELRNIAPLSVRICPHNVYISHGSDILKEEYGEMRELRETLVGRTFMGSEISSSKGVEKYVGLYECKEEQRNCESPCILEKIMHTCENARVRDLSDIELEIQALEERIEKKRNERRAMKNHIHRMRGFISGMQQE